MSTGGRASTVRIPVVELSEQNNTLLINQNACNPCTLAHIWPSCNATPDKSCDACLRKGIECRVPFEKLSERLIKNAISAQRKLARQGIRSEDWYAGRSQGQADMAQLIHNSTGQYLQHQQFYPNHFIGNQAFQSGLTLPMPSSAFGIQGVPFALYQQPPTLTSYPHEDCDTSPAQEQSPRQGEYAAPTSTRYLERHSQHNSGALKRVWKDIEKEYEEDMAMLEQYGRSGRRTDKSKNDTVESDSVEDDSVDFGSPKLDTSMSEPSDDEFCSRSFFD